MKAIPIGAMTLFLFAAGCGTDRHTPDPASLHDASMPKDPVCGMMVDKAKARTTMFAGKGFYFCSDTCQGKFKSQPSVYWKGDP
jgi:Cu+-exporting ATPase